MKFPRIRSKDINRQLNPKFEAADTHIAVGHQFQDQQIADFCGSGNDPINSLLPRKPIDAGQSRDGVSFRSLLHRWDLLRLFFALPPVFRFFHLFNFSTEMTTLLYFVYILIIFIGPVVGQISNRFGLEKTLLGGSIILMPYIAAIVFGILGGCSGFSTIHTAVVGSLNRKLISKHGRANALYVLFYYIGDWLGITGTGFAYQQGGWNAVVCICLFLLVILVVTDIADLRARNG